MVDNQQNISKSQEVLNLMKSPDFLINGNYEGKHIISVDQFEREDLNKLFQDTLAIRRGVREDIPGIHDICQRRVLASLFFEASTRTDMSFQAAMRRLGGEVINASNGVQFSSVYKGENLSDTIRAVGCYADVIVLRHPQVGSTYEAALSLDMLNQKTGTVTSLISGGDGIGEHPTQALLDLFTIEDLKGRQRDLSVTLVGDLFNGRTVHSLGKLLTKNGFENLQVNLVSPASLKMPPEVIVRMVQAGIQVEETSELMDVISQTDVIYWTRVQEERFEGRKDEYESIKDSFIMTPSVLAHAKPNAILMHPLPRKNEMGTEDDHEVLDQDPRAVYFEEMENGMWVRMALIANVLGKI